MSSPTSASHIDFSHRRSELPPIPYLNAKRPIGIGRSRIAGKVWRKDFGANIEVRPLGKQRKRSIPYFLPWHGTSALRPAARKDKKYFKRPFPGLENVCEWGLLGVLLSGALVARLGRRFPWRCQSLRAFSIFAVFVLAPQLALVSAGSFSRRSKLQKKIFVAHIYSWRSTALSALPSYSFLFEVPA